MNSEATSAIFKAADVARSVLNLAVRYMNEWKEMEEVTAKPLPACLVELVDCNEAVVGGAEPC